MKPSVSLFLMCSLCKCCGYEYSLFYRLLRCSFSHSIKNIIFIKLYFQGIDPVFAGSYTMKIFLSFPYYYINITEIVIKVYFFILIFFLLNCFDAFIINQFTALNMSLCIIHDFMMLYFHLSL